MLAHLPDSIGMRDYQPVNTATTPLCLVPAPTRLAKTIRPDTRIDTIIVGTGWNRDTMGITITNLQKCGTPTTRIIRIITRLFRKSWLIKPFKSTLWGVRDAVISCRDCRMVIVTVWNVRQNPRNRIAPFPLHDDVIKIKQQYCMV
jgi:hypothetical protein